MNFDFDAAAARLDEYLPTLTKEAWQFNQDDYTSAPPKDLATPTLADLIDAILTDPVWLPQNTVEEVRTLLDGMNQEAAERFSTPLPSIIPPEISRLLIYLENGLFRRPTTRLLEWHIKGNTLLLSDEGDKSRKPGTMFLLPGASTGQTRKTTRDITVPTVDATIIAPHELLRQGFSLINYFYHAFKGKISKMPKQTIMRRDKRIEYYQPSFDSPHPLIGIVQDYLKRLPVVSTNRADTARIQYARVREVVDDVECKYFSPELGEEQHSLPGLREMLQPDGKYMPIPLRIFDGMNVDSKRTSGELRLFMNILSDVGEHPQWRKTRSGGVIVHTKLRDLVSHMFPRGFKRYSDMPRLRTWMLRLHNALIEDRGGLRRVVGTAGPWVSPPYDYPLDGRISWEVFLSKSDKPGVRIHRETLDYLGVTSALMYRLMLGAYTAWDNAAREGAYPYATRPEVLRNSHGTILDQRGQPVLRKSGGPIKRWSDDRAVPTGAREQNPSIQYLPDATDDYIMALSYPLTKFITSNVRSKYVRRTRQALDTLSEVGLIDQVDYQGHVKITPPLGWGRPGWDMPDAVRELGLRRKPDTPPT